MVFEKKCQQKKIGKIEKKNDEKKKNKKQEGISDGLQKGEIHFKKFICFLFCLY